jgi:DNA polymerase-3 subunit epsilon
MQRLAALRVVEEMVAARPDGSGGWELTVIRSGRLAAAGTAARGVDPYPVIDALVATADVVDDTHQFLAEETECILRWLEEPGTRLVRASSPWAMPAFGAGGLRAFLTSPDTRGADPLADRRRLPMAARPVRASA